MDITDIFNSALITSINSKFTVKIFDDTEKEMTYFELGLFLINNIDSIDKIIISEKI